jgi:hypothetical protein
MSIDIDIDIDIQKFRTAIDDNITKFNSIVEVNNKCSQKLKKINLLKEKIENSDINPNLKIKLHKKEKEILNISLKITEIQTTEKLTIKEIMSEIITINNILNNNIITNFLIKIKQIKPLDYNLIIEITIKLIKDLKDLDKIDNYLLNTTQYNYINKLINNYLYNCIKIQNKTFEDFIVKINNIDKILKEKHNNNIIKEFEDVNTKIDNTIVEKYINYNKDYKKFIEFLKKCFSIYNNDYNQLINSLIIQYNEYDELKKTIINPKNSTYIKNNFTIMNIYKNNISINLKKSDNEYFKLIDEYNMILYYFDYIENFIKIKINYNEYINIEEQNITKEDKEYQQIIFEEIILQNKNEIIKKLIDEINNCNLKDEIKKELLKNIELDKLDDYIIFKCINYFNIKSKEQNQEQNQEQKQESIKNKNILQLLDKLLKIFVQEQKLELKDILDNISKKNQELNEYISIFEHKEKNLISIFNLKINNDVRNNIYILKKYLFQEFKYDYKNNFKQILINYDLEKLQNNIDKISVLHNNIQYFIDKLNYHIDLLKEKDSDLKYFIQIKDKQKEILNDIFNIKLIIQNIKEKSLNKILKENFDKIQNFLNSLINSSEKEKEKDKIINKFKEIENYFIFKPEINITINDNLKKIFDFLNPYISLKNIVNEMIILEEKHNKENIEKLIKYKEVKLYKDSINDLLQLINKFKNDEVLETVYNNLEKINYHLNNNESDKNFNLIMKHVDELMNIDFDFNYNNLFKLDTNFDVIYTILKIFIKKKNLFDNIKEKINVLNKELDKFYNINGEYFTNSSYNKKIEINIQVKENIRINIEHINNILLKNENPVNINILINLIKNINKIIIDENFWIGDYEQNQIKIEIGNKFLKLLDDIDKKLSELLSNIEKIEKIENIEPIFKYKNNDNFKKIIEDIEILIQDIKNNTIMSNIFKIKETLNKSELIEDDNDYISIKNQINIILNEVGCDTFINRYIYSEKNNKLCEIKEKIDNFKGLLITSNPSVISIITEISTIIERYITPFAYNEIKIIVKLLNDYKYKKIIYNNSITKYDDIIKTIDYIIKMLNIYCSIDEKLRSVSLLDFETNECKLVTKFNKLKTFIS